LQALSDVAARLNAQSDTVTQLIEQFQDKLRALNIGLEAWVLLKSEPGSVVVPVPGPRVTTPRQPAPATPVTMEVSVGHARGDEGGACMSGASPINPRPSIFPPTTGEIVSVAKWIKLVDASRAIRVEALGAFPKLLEALKTAAESAVQKIENAKKFVR
jgi:hypothetical protein